MIEFAFRPVLCGGRRLKRRAASTLEIILVLPVLLIASLAIFEFGVLMVLQQTVTTAATEGARAAAREPTAAAANQSALLAVNRVLRVHRLFVDGSAVPDPNSDTRMVLEYGVMAPIYSGDPGVDCFPPDPVMTAADVRVSVCVSLTKSPLLNLLSAFGFDLAGKRLEIAAMARRE